MTKTEKTSLYNKLVLQYENELYRYAYKITNGNKAISEDIVQDTLLRAWNGLEKLKEHEKSKSWLITILKRENIRRIHKERVNITDNFEDFEYLLTTETTIEKEIDKNIILKTIQELKDCYQKPLILQIFLGLSVEEIAEETNLNENTVSTRIFRAKNLLEKRLNQKIKIDKDVKVKYELF